jgi:enoyl-CoA hydratase/carnithine racemase
MTDIVVEHRGAAAVVSIERPQRLNALTFAMIAEIRSVVDRAVADPTITGIVVTGSGRAFSAGLDMEDLARSSKGGVDITPRDTRPRDRELPALFAHLLSAPKPIIAAINGVCAGGGLVLAMMCDLRFATPQASFTTAFSKRGLVAEHGTAWLLPRLMGTSRALDILWSSRRFDAAEAHHMGLVDRIVDAEQLVESCCAYIDDLAANVAPRSIATMKQQVYSGWSQTIEASLADTNVHVKASLTHPDLVEGVASFVERRPPRFAPLSSDQRSELS